MAATLTRSWWQGLSRNEVDVEGRDGKDSSCSLMVDLPPFVTRVREAVPPASSNSSNSLRNFWSSAFILNPESEFTTSHFDNFHSTGNFHSTDNFHSTGLPVKIRSR